MPGNLILVAAAFACTMLFVLLIGVAVSGGDDRRLKKRLSRVSAGRAASGNVSAAPTLRLTGQESSMPVLDRLALRLLPNHDVLQRRLLRTGRQITVGHFCLWMGGTALVVTALMALLTSLGLLPSILIGVLAGLALPYWLVGQMAVRRVARFNALFPDAIDLIVRAIKSGLPITEAIITVGSEVPDPVGEEFRKIEGGMRVGRNLEDILWEVAERLDTPEFRFFVISLSVQRQTGGNLAETLENLSEILRRRRQMVLKIRALTSEARASAMILGALPFVVLGMIMMTSPNYITPLFTDARGNVMLAVAGIMLLTGTIIMAKLIKFEI
ncbi:MAG TPA: type II secretion system F family protein [Aliidongia sp.]|nr:type II secretion system F family protein [Aliidongia sp.]